jgi:hypothetical protein
MVRYAHSSCSHYVACSTAVPAIPPAEHTTQLRGAQECLHVGTRAVPCWIQPNSFWCASTHTMLSLRNSLSTCHGCHFTDTDVTLHNGQTLTSSQMAAAPVWLLCRPLPACCSSCLQAASPS